MELNGTVVAILPTEEGVSKSSGKAWKRAGLVIEHEGGQYPRKCVMQTMNDGTIKRIEALQVGQTVECSINIDAREYKGKWYPDIQVWKIVAEQVAAPQPQQVDKPPF